MRAKKENEHEEKEEETGRSSQTDPKLTVSGTVRNFSLSLSIVPLFGSREMKEKSYTFLVLLLTGELFSPFL